MDFPAETDTGDDLPGGVVVHDRTCPLCDRNNADVPTGRYSHGRWRVKRCAGCGFVYIDQAPDYGALGEALAWERTTKVEEKRRARLRTTSWRLSKFTRSRLHMLPRRQVADLVVRHAKPGNIVELGCGSGHWLTTLPARYVPFGIEISAGLAAQARDLLEPRGGSIIQAPCTEGLARFEDGFFASAVLRSYLEHEARPRILLDMLNARLAPGGVAIVKVPNYGSLNRLVMGRRWCGFRYPDHLNYFTPATLSAMARATGYTIRFVPFGRLPTSDNMWAILTKA